MKRRFLAMFLAGGLMLGMCGCGNNQGDSPAPLQTEYATQDEQEVKPEESEPTPEVHHEIEAAPEESSVEAEDTKAEQEDAETLTNKPSENTPGIDLSEILTEHIIEYEDTDGYQIQEIIRFSQIFRESDMEVLVATWEALGGNVDEITVGDECFSWAPSISSTQKALGLTGGQYIIGDRTIVNQTDGFPITATSAKNYSLMIRMDMKELSAAASQAAENSTTASTFYEDKLELHSSRTGSFTMGAALMEGDQWGPTRFIIVLPDKDTPNEPNGLDYSAIKYSAVVSGALKESTAWSTQYYQ